MVAKPPKADRFEAFACLKKGPQNFTVSMPRVFKYGTDSQ